MVKRKLNQHFGRLNLSQVGESMAKVRVAFHKILQNTQNYHSFDKSADHMVSTLFFSLEVGGRHYQDLRVEIRQPFGTDFRSEPVEVASPVGSYVGPWNHAAFRNLCERCYRKAVGAEGSGIRITGGKDIRMWDNIIGVTSSGEFEVPESGAESW